MEPTDGVSIAYDDPARLAAVLDRIATYPPLVSAGEIASLRRHLAAARRGEAFVLQGGNCVERFSDATPGRIADTLKILLQMSVVLTYAARTPVVRIGRLAGQYFKPRSAATETIDGHDVLTFRGDPVHAYEPEGSAQSIVQARTPDPDRLERGYFHAAATLNYVRAMIAGGFADLHHPQAWDLDSMKQTAQWHEYQALTERILEAIHFMESFGGARQENLGSVELFTAHEALHLPWEQAMTRSVDGSAGSVPARGTPAGGSGQAAAPATGQLNLSAHTVWLGARTGEPDGEHARYLAGIQNPVGIKVGPAMTSERLTALLERIDPARDEGRVMLVSRMGAGGAAAKLPALVAAAEASGHQPVWMCDPMHGNTVSVAGGAAGGRKTRRFEEILAEVRETFGVHQENGSHLAGLHFELTGDNVTECIGGSVPLAEADLERNYESVCDPRLNYTQAMEIAFLVARELGGR